MPDLHGEGGVPAQITLSPLRRCRRGKQEPPWCLPFFLLFLTVFPEWHCRNPDWGSPGIEALPVDESSPSPLPDIGFASRVFETSVRWSPEPFCAANQHMRSEPGRGPRPLPAVWPVRHPKTVRSRPRFGRRFFFSLFLFCFPPVTGGKTAWLRAAAKAVKHPPVH